MEESIATVLGKIKSLYIRVDRIRFLDMVQQIIERKSDTQALNCIYKLVSPETNTLFQKYFRVGTGEGDKMTIELVQMRPKR